MNHSNTQPHDDAFAPLDADLASLVADLDALGAADRAAAPASLTTSVVAAIAASGELAGVRAQAAELGAIDRAAAHPELESRVFQSSREHIGPPAALRPAGNHPHVHDGAARTPRRALRFPGSRFVPLAATLALGTGLAVLVLALRPGSSTPDVARSGTTTPTALSSEQLAAQIERDMDALFIAMQDAAPKDSDRSSPTSESTAEWLNDLSINSGGAS